MRNVSEWLFSLYGWFKHIIAPYGVSTTAVICLIWLFFLSHDDGDNDESESVHELEGHSHWRQNENESLRMTTNIAQRRRDVSVILAPWSMCQDLLTYLLTYSLTHLFLTAVLDAHVHNSWRYTLKSGEVNHSSSILLYFAQNHQFQISSYL